jgi:S-adenosylmethionine uptake transporter
MQSLWMLVGSLSFACMAALVKMAAPLYKPTEILFYRCLISLALITIFAYRRKLTILTPHWRAHLRRAACGTFSMGVWYYTLGVLPLSLAVTLNYTSPLFLGLITLVSGLKLGQSVSPKLYLALALGFVGVVFLLNPVVEGINQFAAMLGLLAGFVAAFAFRDVKFLTSLGEPEWRLVFYFSAFSSLAALIGMVVSGTTPHTIKGVLLLLGIGTLATIGQLAVSRAFGRGSPLVSASLQYSGVIFAAMLGLLVWNEKIGIVGWIGIAIISSAGVMATLNSRKESEARRKYHGNDG